MTDYKDVDVFITAVLLGSKYVDGSGNCKPRATEIAAICSDIPLEDSFGGWTFEMLAKRKGRFYAYELIGRVVTSYSDFIGSSVQGDAQELSALIYQRYKGILILHFYMFIQKCKQAEYHTSYENQSKAISPMFVFSRLDQFLEEVDAAEERSHNAAKMHDRDESKNNSFLFALFADREKLKKEIKLAIDGNTRQEEVSLSFKEVEGGQVKEIKIVTKRKVITKKDLIDTVYMYFFYTRDKARQEAVEWVDTFLDEFSDANADEKRAFVRTIIHRIEKEFDFRTGGKVGSIIHNELSKDIEEALLDDSDESLRKIGLDGKLIKYLRNADNSEMMDTGITRLEYILFRISKLYKVNILSRISNEYYELAEKELEKGSEIIPHKSYADANLLRIINKKWSLPIEDYLTELTNLSNTKP